MGNVLPLNTAANIQSSPAMRKYAFWCHGLHLNVLRLKMFIKLIYLLKDLHCQNASDSKLEAY